jgi:hypothetical protein
MTKSQYWKHKITGEITPACPFFEQDVYNWIRCDKEGKEMIPKYDKQKLYEEKEKARTIIFDQIDHLDNCTHVLEATANTHYQCNKKMWNVLLKARDSIKPHIEKEKSRLYDEVTKIDKEYEDKVRL